MYIFTILMEMFLMLLVSEIMWNSVQLQKI